MLEKVYHIEEISPEKKHKLEKEIEKLKAYHKSSEKAKKDVWEQIQKLDKINEETRKVMKGYKVLFDKLIKKKK